MGVRDGRTETGGPSGSQQQGLPPYTVLISLYAKEKPEYLQESMGSIFNQTVPPEQVVIVKDGALTSELDSMLNQYSDEHPGLFTFSNSLDNG